MSKCKTEYITKEQAISVVTASTDYDEGWLVEDIEALPAADVVEVVRCEDCRYYNAYVGYPMGDCMYWVVEEDLPIKLPVYGNDYCSRGDGI